jgi:hypothetical protein
MYIDCIYMDVGIDVRERSRVGAWGELGIQVQVLFEIWQGVELQG